MSLLSTTTCDAGVGNLANGDITTLLSLSTVSILCIELHDDDDLSSSWMDRAFSLEDSGQST